MFLFFLLLNVYVETSFPKDLFDYFWSCFSQIMSMKKEAAEDNQIPASRPVIKKFLLFVNFPA